MQYVNDALWNTSEYTEVTTINYLDTFSLLKNKLLDYEENQEDKNTDTRLIQFAIELLACNDVSFEDFDSLALEDLNDAADILVELLSILNDHTDCKDIDLNKIPRKLHRFFTLEKSISLYKMFEASKPSKKKTTRRSRSKMLF